MCVPFEGSRPVSEVRSIGFPRIGLFEFSLIVIAPVLGANTFAAALRPGGRVMVTVQGMTFVLHGQFSTPRNNGLR